MCSQGQSNAVFLVSTMMNLLLLCISTQKSGKVFILPWSSNNSVIFKIPNSNVLCCLNFRPGGQKIIWQLWVRISYSFMLSELIHLLLRKSWQAKQEKFWRKKKSKSRRKGWKDIFQANSVMSVKRVRFPSLNLDMHVEGWVLNCERSSLTLCRAMISGICPREKWKTEKCQAVSMS